LLMAESMMAFGVVLRIAVRSVFGIATAVPPLDNVVLIEWINQWDCRVINWQSEIARARVIGIQLYTNVTGVFDYGNNVALPELVCSVVCVSLADNYYALSRH
jgi:hypothetical protein